MRSEPSPTRSRTRGQRTATGPMPVTIARSGRCPWRTSRCRPSSVSWSAWRLSKAATSASTACESSARAPLRRTSVSGSENVPGWESWKTLLLATAYHSFGGEVGGFEHPHDTPPYPFMPSPTFAHSSVEPGETVSRSVVRSINPASRRGRCCSLRTASLLFADMILRESSDGSLLVPQVWLAKTREKRKNFRPPFQVRSATGQHRRHGGVSGGGKGRGQGL